MILSDYLKPHNMLIDEKFHQLTYYNVLSSASFSSFFKKIEKLEGDIVECGIGRSRSLVILSSLLINSSCKRTLYAFDSFEGFPEPTEEDLSKRNPKKGDWNCSPSGKYKYTEDFCLTILKEAEIPLDKLKLEIKKGFFNESLPKANIEKIALLNIDGDLYSSYKDCLTYLYDKVVPGGIILFDDFSEETAINPAFPGARKATLEFLGKEKYEKIQKNEFGVYFLEK